MDLWVLTDDDVKQLTGKSMIDFTSSALDHMEENQQKVMTTTALVIAILQTRCVRFQNTLANIINQGVQSANRTTER